jgi:hypothetical protein
MPPHLLSRSVALAACALVLVACGSGDAGADTGVDANRGVDAAATDSSATDAAPLADVGVDASAPTDATIDVFEALDASAPDDAFVSPPPVYCGHPADCPPDATCAADGTCRLGGCTATPCIFGYTCVADACTPIAAGACDRDSDCAAGACIDGVCTPRSELCFDASQCAAGDRCAAGKCTPGCASSAACGGGYGCDLALGLCTVPLRTCTITNDCGGASSVCVAGACVPRSFGASCPSDAIWIENGCVPVQGFPTTCVTTGIQDACAPGSICIHHSCFVTCDPASGSACASEPVLNQCKPVTVDGTTFDVCGTPLTLGSECSPPDGVPCSGGGVCIDGFCV